MTRFVVLAIVAPCALVGCSGGVEAVPDLKGNHRPPPQDAASALIQERCPEVAAAAHYCLSLNAQQPGPLFAVSPDTGDLCALGMLPPGADLGKPSIAVLGTDLLGCSPSVDHGPHGVLWRVPIEGGQVEMSDVPCGSVAARNGRLILAWAKQFFDHPDDVPVLSLASYPSFEAAVADARIESLEIQTGQELIALDGDAVWAGHVDPGHTTNVDAYALWTGELVATTHPKHSATGLEAFEVTSDGLIVTLQGSPGSDWSAAYPFDRATGDLKVISPFGAALRGLRCWTNP